MNDISGTYQVRGQSCTAGTPGESGGPAVINRTGLRIGGLSCSFTSRTGIARMNALLVDASCTIQNKPRSTRFFMNSSPQGITVVSRELGTFVLEACM